MGKARKLTEVECEVLKENPAVKEARPNRFSLTFEFREGLYEYWFDHGQSPQTVRDYLADHGFDVSRTIQYKLVSVHFIISIQFEFLFTKLVHTKILLFLIQSNSVLTIPII